MASGSTSIPNPSMNPGDGSPRLSPNVVGACLRSAFIEALYDDCTGMLPAETATQSTPPLPLAAE
jgi:hypothetical protein